MKKALMKDTIKEIKNTYRRFISILLMAFLGVGFFAGLRASSPDMLNTIDKYYKDNNVYDIQVMSTLGLTNEDVEELKKVENVEGVYGTYTQDAIINIDEVESVAKILCVEEINKPVLIDGRLPENESECVVEELFMRANSKRIGDKIEIHMEDMADDEGNKVPFLKNKELKIVGVAKSPLYISMEKGTSKLGAGRVNYYIYVDDENINYKDVYTEIYIKAKGSENYVTSTDEYEDYIEKVKANVEKIKEEREQARHDMLVDKANKKVDEAQKTFDEEKANAEKQISDAEKQIQDAKAQIENGQSEINRNKAKAEKEFASAQKQINDGKNKLNVGEVELQTKEQEANKQMEDAQNKKTQLQENLNSLNVGLNQVDSGLADANQSLQNPNLTEEQKLQIEATKKTLEDKKQELRENKSQLENGIVQIEQGIQSGQNELAKAKQTLNNSKAELKAQEEKFLKTKNSTYAQLDKAQKTLNDSKTKLAEGEAELEKNKQEFNKKITDAEGELIDARDKISEIENATWYILDRNANQGYVGFINDTKSIDSLGAVFPLVFFVIATLISLTSMTRMVEEQRTQIGTFKALGYKKIQIASKYIIYASSACIIGGVLGMQIGCAFLPRIVWRMYSMMYSIENFVIKFNAFYGFVGLFAAFVCIVGATIYATYKELINTPAVLMRPKAPKIGKKVILEHIPIIWNHLSFTRKVTVRNLFRYKKRFLMTIIGIMGCTALILVGFGIKDSITSLIPKQYEDVFSYDMQISLKSNLQDDQYNKILDEVKNEKKVDEVVETNILTGKLMKEGNSSDSKSVDIQIIIPNDYNELEKVVNLRDRKTYEKVNLSEMKENEITISDKAADLIDVKQGDIVTIRDSDDVDTQYIVSDIVENYVGHYVYMTKDLYEKSFEKNYETNLLYLKNEEMTQDEEDKFVKKFVDKNEVSAVNAISTTTKTIGDMMTSLNYVVIILIVSAGILAFVVLYNLSNVNISERIRELSTIKVLGFYDKEVYNYISRETVILTSIGIVLGCIGGYFLNSFILATCELESMRFGKFIKPESYVYSILITIVFTLIVNIVTYFSLKKIDMIESLKSVE